MTLAQIGVPTVRVTRLSRTRVIERFGFTLPPGATQGPADWYLIHYHVRVVRPAVARGTVLLTAETDGMTGAQIEYRMTPSAVDWSTVSQAEPTRQEHTTARTIDAQLTNYLQSDGVRGGRNTGDFRVELDGGARLDAVQVLGDTCLERTTLTPETVQIDTQDSPPVATVGDIETVRVRVHNVGTRPLTRLTVSAPPFDTGLVALSPKSVSTADVTGAWTAAFRYRATAAGRHPVLVGVGTAISAQIGGGLSSVQVEAAPKRGTARWAGPVGGALVVLVSVVLLVGRIVARRNSTGSGRA